MKNDYLLTILLLLISLPIFAAEFCVTSSAGLQAALNSAANNNQHDLIKIAEGSYTTPGSEFSYTESVGWDLEISGGWTEFFGNPCGQQLSGNPFNTVLDGDSSNRIMNIRSGGSSDITISSLAFINGGTSNLSNGGGLRFWPTNTNNHTGKVVIERSAFINNTAEEASAISFLSAGLRNHIRNNIFVVNSTTNGSNTVVINQDLSAGIYFTNNTMVTNSGDAANNRGGLRIFTTSTSNAYVGNNVLYDNGSEDFRVTGSGQVYLHYNNVDLVFGASSSSLIGNFSADPEFNPGILNYTPSYGSPLVNQGYDPPNIVPFPTPFNLAWFEGTVDIFGNPRKQDGKVDIGAVETEPEPPIFANGFE